MENVMKNEKVKVVVVKFINLGKLNCKFFDYKGSFYYYYLIRI